MMAFWGGLPKWMQDSMLFVGALIIAVLTGKWMLARHDDGVRREERQKQEVESAQEQVRINETRVELQETRTNEIREATDAASAHAVDGSVDELRQSDPSLAAIVYGPARTRSSPPEGR